MDPSHWTGFQLATRLVSSTRVSRIPLSNNAVQLNSRCPLHWGWVAGSFIPSEYRGSMFPSPASTYPLFLHPNSHRTKCPIRGHGMGTNRIAGTWIASPRVDRCHRCLLSIRVYIEDRAIITSTWIECRVIMAVTELNDGISDKDNRDKLNSIEFASAIYLVHHSARLSMHIIRHHVN